MDATMEQAPINERSAVATRGWPWLLAALALAFVVHAPSLSLGFVDDDYEFWLETVRRMEDPQRLVRPFGGVRLTNPILMMPDIVIWGQWLPGWHVTNLAIHGAVMVLLFGLIRRLTLGAPAAAALVAVWGISPFTSYQVREIHQRLDPLLFACWLGIGLLWPGEDQRWKTGRALAAATLAVVSAVTKESWVILPGLAFAFDLAVRRSSARRALRTAILWTAGPLLYLAVYTLWPAVEASYAAGYWSGGLSAAAKIPSTFAAFCGLATLDVSSQRFGPAEWLSVVALVALAALTARTLEPLLVEGLAFFFLPFVPVIPVGFMTARYACVPFAGFLMILAGLARLAGRHASSAVGRLAVGGLAGAAVLALAAFSLTVAPREMADADRRDEGHRKLLEEALAFRARMPLGRPLVCVRLERLSVNSRVLEEVEGLPKAYFERANYPYGLVRWAELMSWTGWRRGGPLWEEVPWDEVPDGPFAVIGHADGRFLNLEAGAPTAAAAAAGWSARGFPVRSIRPVPEG